MDPDSTILTPEVWMRIVTSARIEADGNIRILPEGLAAMCRTVDDFRGISKERNERTRAKNPVKRKRTNLKDTEVLATYIGKIQKTIPALLLEFEEMNSQSSNGKKKVITPEIVSERIGLGNKVVRRNATLFSAYKEVIKGFVGQPLFDNEHKK